jgi:fatty-acyl-CoA synthase
MTQVEAMAIGGSSECVDLPSLFEKAASAWGGDGSALIAYRSSALDGPKSELTRAGLASEIRRTATFLRQQGIGQSDRIALLLPTIPEIHLLLWGGMAVGSVALINPLLQTNHVMHLVDEVGARLLCVPTAALSPQLADVGETIARARPDLKILRVGPDGFFPACLAAVDGSAQSFPKSVEAEAALFHTGGTTGRPKIAPLTLSNLLSAARLLTLVLDYAPSDRFFSPLPLFHIAGAIVGGLAPFLAGTTVIMPSPLGLRDPAVVADCWKLLERERATMMVAVPTSLAALCNVPVGDADLSSLSYVLTGTSPLPEETARRFTALTGKQVHTGYGMTETSGVIAYAPRHESARPTTTGKPLPGLEVRVQHLDREKTQIGRVLVRGPNVFAGYLDGKGIPDDGWIDSGDLGFIDQDGWLTLTGRSKDLIIRGGHNIDPAVIEEAAVRHPSVVLAAAVGQIDDYAGEVPVLYVQLQPGADEHRVLAELQADLNASVAEPPARPRAIRIFDPMPTTAVGKIFKPTLRLDAARLEVEALLLTQGVTAEDISVAHDDGGQITIKVILSDAFASSCATIQALIERYPVKAAVRVKDGVSASG